MHVEELPGLPGEPPYPVPIAVPGASTFREGYVLRIEPSQSEAWVGNFQTGSSHYSAFLDLQNDRLAVVAGGQGYVVDGNRRSIQHTFGGGIAQIIAVPGTAQLLVIGDVDVECHSSSHQAWRSRRIAWDGIDRVQVDGNVLSGLARHFDDSWHEFRLNLSTGEHTGGAYEGEA